MHNLSFGTLVRITKYPGSNTYMVTRVDTYGNVFGRLVINGNKYVEEFLGHREEMYPA